jgi:hypothetical protein
MVPSNTTTMPPPSRGTRTELTPVYARRLTGTWTEPPEVPAAVPGGDVMFGVPVGSAVVGLLGGGVAVPVGVPAGVPVGGVVVGLLGGGVPVGGVVVAVTHPQSSTVVGTATSVPHPQLPPPPVPDRFAGDGIPGSP